MDIDQVNLIIDPLITRDNDSNVEYKRTLHYVVPELLQTLGIIADAGQGANIRTAFEPLLSGAMGQIRRSGGSVH